jgi:Fe-S-cluster containining protein
MIAGKPEAQLARRLAQDLAKALAQALAQAQAQGGPLALRQACARALAEARGLDEPGCRAVLDSDAELPGLMSGLLAACAAPGGESAPVAESERLAGGLAGRLTALAQAQACLGCGTCCRVSSPTLYAEDLACLGPGGLARAELFTLRAGELAHSARLGAVLALPEELIKLREGPGGGCARLEDSRCGVYARRPLQCRHLKCWSGRHAGQLQDRPRLARADIYAGDENALGLMAEYELRLPAAGLTALLAQAAQGEEQARKEALALMELDHRLRAGISGRYGYPPAELDLLLGRPSWELALAHGLALGLDQAGRPALSARQGGPV